MQCLVTAGPTYEKLDEVRRLTNFSTGRLGAELAAFLTALGHEVTLLVGEQATWPGERRATDVRTFSTTTDLFEQLAAFAGPDVDAMFHVAAVSDFTFGRVFERRPDGALKELHAGKISTRQGTVLAELVPTPKLIGRLRDLFPRATIVGWKYEVDGDRESALALAKRQVAGHATDACVANGRAYGDGFGLVTAGNPPCHCASREELFNALAGLAVRKT